MTRPARISVDEALGELPGWSRAIERDAIVKTFRFSDFKAAFEWMTVVALLADKLDHHPEWFNVYNRVDVTLTTHDSGGVTTLDVEMAAFMDGAVS